jgi:nitrate/TMAO reductase-like tetraheme cytochrome c subunit
VRQNIFKKFIFLTLLMMLALVTSCAMYKEMQGMKKPRYEAGEYKGAKFCANCHRGIYDEWSNNSRHAVATTAESFYDFRDKFTDRFLFNAIFGESACYACHGSKKANEGVSCETCHGTVIPNASIMETHAKKFKPGRERLKEQDFCAKCHEFKSPVSGDSIISLYSEWQKSQAAANGTTCQGCHMAPRGSKFSYHGFDTAYGNIGIYSDDLKIKDINLDFPQFSLALENRITAHAMPPSGPTRILALEITLLDLDGVEVYKITETFAKKFKLLLGIFPNKLIENTQLQSGEVRQLSFTLPSSIEGKINKAVLVLRFYEVAHEYQDDIKKAHWISDPILEEEVSL